LRNLGPYARKKPKSEEMNVRTCIDERRRLLTSHEPYEQESTEVPEGSVADADERRSIDVSMTS
jgi:hypothetical protein